MSLAYMLSQYKNGSCLLNSDPIHFTSIVKEANAMYSHSIEDRATIFCLVEDYNTKLSLKNA